MEIVLMVAKYTLLGIFVFLGATVVTKTIGRYVNKSQSKDDDETK